ncbi:hypothetical protein Q1695_000533 [Nippostrongylus brasiliensis]|nr:hypothetical protein Q1695_000533 [Nippostrongylus brasiliensis]
MGAQESSAKKPQQVIDVQEDVAHDAMAYKLWSDIHQAVKNRQTKCTIFIKKFDSNGITTKCYDNGIKLLKCLKHPYILKFLDGSCTTSDACLVTERVEMLDHAIESLSFPEIQSGLRHILVAIVFLYTKASLSHNNVNPGTVFVATSGEWKLGGFEFATPHDVPLDPDSCKFHATARLEQFVIPKEQCQSGSESRSFHSDVYSFGKLIDYALSYCDAKDAAVQNLRKIAAQLTSGDKVNLDQLAELVDDDAFSNPLVSVTDFCNTIHLRTDAEKAAFFSNVVNNLRSIPADVVSRRLCRLLLSRYVLLEPRSQTDLYPFLLSPKEDGDGILPLDLFTAHMIPELLRLFRVKEAALRLVLLAHFDRYARYISKDKLTGFITDEIFEGAHDHNDRVVAQSLRALASLVEFLGAEAVCPWPISKVFASGSPQKSRPRVAVDAVKVGQSSQGGSSDVMRSTGVKTPAAVSVNHNSEPTWADEDDTDWNNDVSWSAEWKETQGSTSNSESPSSGDTTNLGLTVKCRTPLVKTPLTNDSKMDNLIGKEFEISVVKKLCLEDELLADLAPSIPKPPSLIDQLSSLQKIAIPLDGGLPKKVSSKFVMADTPEHDGGWDDTIDESIAVGEDVVANDSNGVSPSQ